MHIETIGNTKILHPSTTDFTSLFNEVVKEFEQIDKYEYHWVLDLLTIEGLNASHLQQLVKMAQTFYANNKSFVCVSNFMATDEFEGLLNIVPTVVEANDLIEMDEIERDLGF